MTPKDPQGTNTNIKRFRSIDRIAALKRSLIFWFAYNDSRLERTVLVPKHHWSWLGLAAAKGIVLRIRRHHDLAIVCWAFCEGLHQVLSVQSMELSKARKLVAG